MVVWLRQDKTGVAVPDGIIRRHAWMKIAALDAAFLDIDAMRCTAREQAERQAQAVIEAAYQEADRIRLDAEIMAQRLFDEAHAEGRQSGIDEWAALLLSRCQENHQQLRQQRERMARIVIAAVEKIVPLQDPQGIYRQVLRMLSKSIQAVRYVTVRVCPEEMAHAEKALRELARDSALGKLIEVTGDERLMRGACLVESDQGIIDLSLSSQLRALRAAVAQTVADSGGGAEGHSDTTAAHG